jgi:hypothetical protein
MIKSDITYQDKLNELRLDISHPNSNGINFIFVEGETDIRLFRKFFNLEKCKVENIPGGNSKLEECVETLVNIYPFIIGIRDSDFIRLEETPYEKKNMFLTDFHDIEVSMLNHEPVLNSLVFEYSDLPKDKHIELREKVVESIISVGYLKWLNFKENFEFEFTAGFHDLVSFVNQDIDFDQYLNRVISKSKNARLTSKEEILVKIEELKTLNPDKMQLTNGHDLLNIFAKYFREECQQKGISGENLACSVRMLFNSSFFVETNLYSELVSWQAELETQLF